MAKKYVTIFFHSADADGWSSAALLDHYLSRNLIDIGTFDKDDDIVVKCKFWNYGFIYRKPAAPEDLVILADIHFPEDQMNELLDFVGDGNVLVLDHHESAFEMLDGMKDRLHPLSVYTEDQAACMHSYDLVTNHLRSNVSIAEKNRIENLNILYHLFNWWDSYTFKELDGSNGIYPIDIIYLNYYMNNVGAEYFTPNGAMFWADIFDKACDQHTLYKEINEMMKVGEILYRSYQKQNCTLLQSYSFDVEFEGYEMLCINHPPGQASAFFEEWKDKNKYDLVCNFYFTKKNEYAFSIYSLKDDIDLTPVWAKYDKIRSGGHKGAGSIRCKDFTYDRNTRSITMSF